MRPRWAGPDRRGDEGSRRAAGCRGRVGHLRRRPHVRQPLRVLLHPPAPAGPADQPLPARRRLPAVVPVRELHHAHPLHGDGPGARHHRAAVPALRVHPRHRPRRAHRPPAQPPRGDQPALAAGPARRGRAGARPGGGLSRHQRRRRCSRTRWSASPTASRSWPPSPWSPWASAATAGRVVCARTPSPRPGPRSTPSRPGRTCSSTPSAAGWSTRPTSTTCSPGVPSPTARSTRASRCTRTASAWPAASSGSSPARSTRPSGPGPASSTGSTAPRPLATGRLGVRSPCGPGAPPRWPC